MAKDLGTGKEQGVKIVASQKLNDDEIEKMKKDAEAHEAEDKRKREEVETINAADSTVYGTEKMLEELKDKIPEKAVSTIREKNEELKKLLEAKERDVKVVKEKLEELNKEVQAASTELYRKAQEEAAKQQAQGQDRESEDPRSGGTGKKKKSKGKVVDAEFTEEDKDKKD